MNRHWWHLVLIVGLLCPLGAACSGGPATEMPEPLESVTPLPLLSKPLRLFLVYSYSPAVPQSGEIRQGILETLARQGYNFFESTLELEEFSLNVTAETASEELASLAQEAVQAIQNYDPDVVIVLNDEAARVVIPVYPDTNQPFVFCGLKGDLQDSGLDRPNVTGVLEHPYPLQTARMAMEITQKQDSFMVLGDDSPLGKTIISEVYRQLISDTTLESRPDLRITSRWEEWQQLVLRGTETSDFILLVGYSGLKDRAENTISDREALQWTLQNAPIPVFGLWAETTLEGAVGGLALTQYEQGVTAAEMSLRIAQGASPSSILATQPARNSLTLNFAAIEHWELRIPLAFLTTARIYRRFPALEEGGR